MSEYTHDLEAVTRITAGAVGQPGQRTFYLQARRGARLISLIAEKEQIRELAAAINRLLEDLAEQNPLLSTVDDMLIVSDMSLEEPLEPEFRIMQLMLGYDPDRDMVLLIAQGLPDEDGEAVSLRLTARRDQMSMLSQHAAQVVAAGRPICGNCSRPIDPAGHFCPQRNGHGPIVGVAS